VPPLDPVVAALAARQEGVVSRAQVLAAGMGAGAIGFRIHRGRLHAQHRGVYSVGHSRLTARARLWAAILACGGGDDAVVSHRSAGALWELIATPRVVDVTTLRRSASAKGIRVHESRTLRSDDITTVDGLAVTSPTRTLIDLADVLTPHRLERACHRAEISRLLDAAGLRRRLAELPGRRTLALEAALASLAPGPQVTRRQLEERMLALLARHELPRPLVNTTVEGYEVDFHWPTARLIVETDGAATHLTATAFEQDRERDAELTVAGYRVVRFTWRQLTERAGTVAGTLRALLGYSTSP
jgi:very-short-patch-repair endonuclease